MEMSRMPFADLLAVCWFRKQKKRKASNDRTQTRTGALVVPRKPNFCSYRHVFTTGPNNHLGLKTDTVPALLYPVPFPRIIPY